MRINVDTTKSFFVLDACNIVLGNEQMKNALKICSFLSKPNSLQIKDTVIIDAIKLVHEIKFA